MCKYNLSTEEITKIIELYSKIPTVEKRFYARGYLKGLGDKSSLDESTYIGEENHSPRRSA